MIPDHRFIFYVYLCLYVDDILKVQQTSAADHIKKSPSSEAKEGRRISSKVEGKAAPPPSGIQVVVNSFTKPALIRHAAETPESPFFTPTVVRLVTLRSFVTTKRLHEQQSNNNSSTRICRQHQHEDAGALQPVSEAFPCTIRSVNQSTSRTSSSFARL